MNTDIRRAIFMILMSSEDYLDAYAKIMKLGLKHKQVRVATAVRRPPFAQLGSPAASSLRSLPPCAASATSAKTKQNNVCCSGKVGARVLAARPSRAGAVRMQSQRTTNLRRLANRFTGVLRGTTQYSMGRAGGWKGRRAGGRDTACPRALLPAGEVIQPVCQQTASPVSLRT